MRVSAVAARESARTADGRFGEQTRADPGQLGLSGDTDRFDLGTIEGLAGFASAVRETSAGRRNQLFRELRETRLSRPHFGAEADRIEAETTGRRRLLMVGAGIDPDSPFAEEELTRLVGAGVAAHAQQVAGVDFDQVGDAAARLEADKEALNRRIVALDRAVSQLSGQMHDRVEASGPVREAAGRLRGPHMSEADHADALDRYAQATYDAWRADPQWAQVEQMRAERAELAEVYRDHDGGRCAAELARLAEGYRQVLGQVRPMGGELVMHERTSRPAVKAFAEAAQWMPTDWVEASNASATPLLGKVGKSRAHYNHSHFQPSKKRVDDRRINHMSPSTAALYDSDPAVDMVPWTPEAGLEGESGRRWGGADPYIETRFVVHDRFGADADPDRPPAGSGWQMWENPQVRGHRLWRRPKTRMVQVGADLVSEISTNPRPDPIGANSATFEVAVHELSHRAENTVGGLAAVERGFVDRRAGGSAPVRLYPGDRGRRDEVGRPGDFVDIYVGREYGSGDREVLSCGTQALFGGAFGGLAGAGRYRADPEHRDVVLGLLACGGVGGPTR